MSLIGRPSVHLPPVGALSVPTGFGSGPGWAGPDQRSFARSQGSRCGNLQGLESHSSSRRTDRAVGIAFGVA
ncbi:MAG: hypothetical protein CMJ23_02110 [Phycisphaerae bacterium]|nr:hypothetical protein [Phycisphaerae bacterium]